MTELLEKAIAAIQSLSPELQDDLARLMLDYVEGFEGVYVLTPEEEEDLAASLAEADRGEFASEEQVSALWAKYSR